MTMCPVEADSFHMDGQMDRWTNKTKLIMVFTILQTCLNCDKKLTCDEEMKVV